MDASPSLRSRAASGASWILLDSLAGQGIAFGVFAVISRLIGPYEFGLVAVSLLFIQSLRPMVFEGVATAVIRQQEASDADYNTSFWLNLALAVALAGTLFAAAGLLERFFAAPGLGTVVRELSPLIVASGLTATHEAWLTRHFRYKPYALRGLLSNTAGGAVGITMAMHGYGVSALVAQQTVVVVTALPLFWLSCGWRPGLATSRGAFLEIMRFMRGNVAATSGSMLIQQLDTLLIGAFYGPAGVGFYNAAKRVKLAAQIVISSPLVRVVFPALIEVQGDAARLRRVIVMSLTVTSAIAAPAFFGVAALADDLVQLAFGPAWAESAGPLALLMVGGWVTCLSTYDERLLVVKNRQDLLVYLTAAYAALAIGCFFALRALGMHVLALPFVAPYFVIYPVSIALVRSLTGVALREWLVAVGQPLFAALVMCAALVGGRPLLEGFHPAARIALSVPAGAIVYAAVLMAVSPALARMALAQAGSLRLRLAASRRPLALGRKQA